MHHRQIGRGLLTWHHCPNTPAGFKEVQSFRFISWFGWTHLLALYMCGIQTLLPSPYFFSFAKMQTIECGFPMIDDGGATNHDAGSASRWALINLFYTLGKRTDIYAMKLTDRFTLSTFPSHELVSFSDRTPRSFPLAIPNRTGKLLTRRWSSKHLGHGVCLETRGH